MVNEGNRFKGHWSFFLIRSTPAFVSLTQKCLMREILQQLFFKTKFFIPSIDTFSFPSLRWAWIVSWHHVHVEYTQQNHDLPKRYFFHLKPFFFIFGRPCQGFWLAYSSHSVSKMKCDGKPSNGGRGLKKMREVWFILLIFCSATTIVLFSIWLCFITWMPGYDRVNVYTMVHYLGDWENIFVASLIHF